MYMNYITTTELRTKSSELIYSLKKGKAVSLVHRSKIVGIIKPVQDEPKTMTAGDIMEIQKLAISVKLPKMTYKQRENSYGENLRKKYG